MINKFTNENIKDFKPSGDAVLIKCKIKEDKTASGIILIEKESVIVRPDRGEVIAVGNSVKEVKVGDFAYFSNQSGYDLFEDEFLYIMIQDAKIFGIS
jgi:co-chaperonin GroES (HSP10)